MLKTTVAAAALALGALAAAPAAHAVPAIGSFGFVPNGAVAVIPGPKLEPGTTGTLYVNGGLVNIPSPALHIASGDFVDPGEFTYAPGLTDGPANLLVTVDGMSWLFDRVQMIAHDDNGVVAHWFGRFWGGGGFDPGAESELSQSCDQTSIVNCSNTMTLRSGQITVREPGSLALLGSLLILTWLGLRRRTD